MSPAGTAACTPPQIRASTIDWIGGWLAMPPTEAVVAQLQSPEGQALLDAIGGEFDCLDAVAQLRTALSAAPAPQLALDIAVTWTRLFEGVMGTPPISLYESAYAVDDEHPGLRPFGCAVDEVNELLMRFDVSIASPGEPADHVAVELALYASLLRRDDADGIALMHARLVAWVPGLIALCRSNDPSGFYGATASLLGVLLEFQPCLAPQESQETQEWSHHAE